MKTNAFSKTYNGKTVLSVAEQEFERGKIYALVGSNGSGKTTFTRIVAGVLSPNEKVRPLQQELSIRYLPQKPYVFRMSVLRNICLSGVSAEKAKKLAARFGLERLLDRPGAKLSGGEGARTAFCRVIACPCDLLLLDEPCAAMDMESVLSAEEQIKEYVSETGCTVLMVTHSLAQAKRIADEIMFFYQGSVWERGPSGDVLNAPRREETKKFIEFFD